MTRAPADYDIIFSSAVSEVLRDIGISEDIVKSRRDAMLMVEAMEKVNGVMKENVYSVYYFGSQSEGTTTRDMNSDIDQLICDNRYNVIHKLSDWKPGLTNLLMIQDDTTTPGYCHLQLTQHDKPLPARRVPNNGYTNNNGRILMKNTIFQNELDFLGHNIQHGPALHFPRNGTMGEQDVVFALRCNDWPKEARSWLTKSSENEWPSRKIKVDSQRSGCFLVPVASKVNEKCTNELEWRISTSNAERCLMFSLDTAQLGCYTLMKLLLKSHINRGCEDVISSYMCKTALMHSVEKNSDPRFWIESNSIRCLNYVLGELYVYVRTKTCPHFIIPGNNLMAERISDKHHQLLLDNIQAIINSNGRVFFEIKTDNIDERLMMKLNIGDGLYHTSKMRFVRRRTIADNLQMIAVMKGGVCLFAMNQIQPTDNIENVIQHFLSCFKRCLRKYTNASQREKEAYKLMLPELCTIIASLRAAEDLTLNRPVSSIALFKLGLISDVSSGWLKLATVYYSSGDFNGAENILRRVEQRYDRRRVLPVCTCYDQGFYRVPGFDEAVEQIQNDEIRQYISYCVMFMRCERIIVLKEMHQEYHRSTTEQFKDRTFLDNRWMNLAVVDSLPYLHFMQYKTYGRLGHRENQERALEKMREVIKDDWNLGHEETALNLLGQCLEEEGLSNEALRCYDKSLKIRPQNNAALFHLARMTKSSLLCSII